MHARAHRVRGAKRKVRIFSIEEQLAVQHAEEQAAVGARRANPGFGRLMDRLL